MKRKRGLKITKERLEMLQARNEGMKEFKEKIKEAIKVDTWDDAVFRRKTQTTDSQDEMDEMEQVEADFEAILKLKAEKSIVNKKDCPKSQNGLQLDEDEILQ